MSEPPGIPRATYRVQLHAGCGFPEAAALVPYLDALGVSHLYTSPLSQAHAGSLHGYDVTDPTALNRELGTERQFDDLVASLRERGMGLLLDIVPNHMAASSENLWWMDLLESGRESPFAEYFDVDWGSAKKSLAHKVLLPILGRPYGKALEGGELQVRLEKGGFFLHYYEHKLPLALRSYLAVLSHRIEDLAETYGTSHPAFRELMDLVGTIEHLPEGAAGDPGRAGERYRIEEEIKERLWALYGGRAEIRGYLDENLRRFNGTAGDPESFALLDRLLDEQHYWLSFWRLANEEINYRRFFAINELVSVRVEDPRVFEISQALAVHLVRDGKVQGLRVDHIDGLYDPHAYLRSLRAALVDESGRPLPCYLVVEKILQEGEPLPSGWPVHGTTGYDFLNAVNGLFVHAGGARELSAAYARFQGRKQDFEELLLGCKRLILDSLFAGEMHALGQHLGELAELDRHARDLPRKELRESLVELTARFPVYRTYVHKLKFSTRDRLYLARALRAAERGAEGESAPVYEFLRRVLTLEGRQTGEGPGRDEWLRFLMRWQQFTGPIMAKGFEDTALYVYHPLSSLNEVGGEPGSAGTPIKDLHARLDETARHWPHTMNASSTHDTKRSEDVRARINVLSELPREWEECIRRWKGWNAGKRTLVGGQPMPGRNEEYLLYQSLLGAWPLDPAEQGGFTERMEQYMVKAAREAKVHTRWIKQQPKYEEALVRFVRAVLDEKRNRLFIKDFLRLQEKVAWYGALNALGQVLVKCAAPGVPDFYQGTELWNLSLVDPDNRSPVDYAARERALAQLQARDGKAGSDLAGELLATWRDGRVKLLVTWKALELRRRRPALFECGSYEPLGISGGRRDLVFAFGRAAGGERAVAVVPRFFTRHGPVGRPPLGVEAWGPRSGVLLPEGWPETWRNALTGERVQVSGRKARRSLHLATLLRRFPFALLEPAE